MDQNDLRIVNEAVGKALYLEGWMSDVELRWLAVTARRMPVIVEVGSWKGRSTKALGGATPGVVYSIDNWKGATNPADVTAIEARTKGDDYIYEVYRTNLFDEIRAGKVVPIRADSGKGVEQLVRLLAGRQVDMVFIDGDHAYQSVKADIENYLPVLRDGGLMSGHDGAAMFPGVVRAIGELMPGYSFAVGSIWQKIISRKP